MSIESMSNHKASRRRFLGLGAAGLGALGLGAAGLSGFGAKSSPALAAPFSPLAAAPSGPVPATSYSSRQIAVAARAFLDGLDGDKQGRAWYHDLGNAARTMWSNFPAGASPRAGIPMTDLSDAQRVLMHDLLRSSTSSQGYLKMTGAIRADDALHDLEQNSLFGAGNYYTSVFGAPEDAQWAWMLTGHHMSALFTVAGDRVAFTPMFTRAQPLQVPAGLYAGWGPLPQEISRANELRITLTSDQKNAAIIGTDAPGDVVAGPGRQQSLTSYAGIPSGQLDDGQQHLLWLLVQEYVRNADFDAAEAQLSLIEQSWTDTHFAWQGPAPSPDARFYYRVHGPRILIEYDVQEPLSAKGGHVHAVTRDPANDYGVDWLGLHYQEQGGAGGPAGGGLGGPGGAPRGAPPSQTP